jgi:hypothetical protein
LPPSPAAFGIRARRARISNAPLALIAVTQINYSQLQQERPRKISPVTYFLTPSKNFLGILAEPVIIKVRPRNHGDLMMTTVHSHDHTPKGEIDYPLPPADEGDPVLNSDLEIVPPPEHRRSELALPVPRARRLLKSEIAGVELAIANLKKVELGDKIDLDMLAIDALVAGATDSQIPLDESLHRIEELREKARRGAFDKYVPLAIDELEDVLVALMAGLAALKAVSLLDEPLPGSWRNLHSVTLARKLNVLGHTLLRGQIAGVRF